MHARVEHVLADDHVRLGEHRIALRLVAGLPIEDVIVGLAFFVGANHRSPRIEGLLGVDDRWKDVVLDLDQFQCVARRVLVLGDHESHLLALEPHLVGGQDGGSVVRERRHPRQAERLEDRARDHGLHLRVSLGRGGIDRLDVGVGDRAAQDRAVQHARHVHVVDVVALATQEASVFLAQHPPEADRVAPGAGGYIGDGHTETSLLSDAFSAAQRMARTMFS